MSLYKNIRQIMLEASSFEANNIYKCINLTVEHLKKTGKQNIAIEMQYSLKEIIKQKQKVKEDIIIAILGISDVEYKEIISKTTHIKKMYAGRYLFLENGFKLKDLHLHSNSIEMICSLTCIVLS